MPDVIESLGIELKADSKTATKAVRNLTSALATLNGALNKFQGSQGYSKGLLQVSSAFKQINDAVNNVDSKKISSIANSMQKIANMSMSQSKKGAIDDVTKINKYSTAWKSAEKMCSQFGVRSKSVIGEVAEAFADFEREIADDNAFEPYERLEKRLLSIIPIANDVAVALGKAMHIDGGVNMLGTMGKGSKIGDVNVENKRIQGKLGFGTSNNSGAITIERLFESLQHQFPEIIGYQTTFNEFLDRLPGLFDLTDQKAITLGDAIKRDEGLAGDFYSTVTKLAEAIAIGGAGAQGLSSAFETLRGGDAIQSIAENLKSFEHLKLDNATQISQIGQAVKNLSNASGGGENISKIASELNKMGQLNIPDTTRLVSLADSFKKLSNAGKAIDNIPKIVSELQRLSSLRNVPNMAWMNAFADGVKKLGSTQVQKATINLPPLAVALKSLVRELSGIGNIDKRVISLVNSLGQLGKAGTKVNLGATNASKGLNLFSKHAKGAQKASFSLASAIGKVYATYWLLFRAFSKLGEAVNLAGSLTEVENVIDATFGNMRNSVDSLVEGSIQKLGMSELSVKQFAGRFQAMGTAMGIGRSQIEKTGQSLDKLGVSYGNATNSIADMSTNLVRLTADIASFYDIEQADVAQDLQAVFTGMTRPLDKLVA